jgi:hypothetical protein
MMAEVYVPIASGYVGWATQAGENCFKSASGWNQNTCECVRVTSKINGITLRCRYGFYLS